MKKCVRIFCLVALLHGSGAADFLARAGKTFHGKIVVGRDLMRF